MQEDKVEKLLNSPLVVINIGLEVFAVELKQQDVETISVDWAPPASGKPELARLLSKLGT